MRIPGMDCSQDEGPVDVYMTVNNVRSGAPRM